MKILKRILFVILGIVAFALIVAIFLKKDYAVEREIVINKPKVVVFDYVKMIKNQDNYSVWNRKDLAAPRKYTGTDGTVGFISAWDSQNKEVGTGEQEIKKIDDGNRIDFELRFKKPFTATDYGYFITEAIDSTQTKVRWGFNGKMDYPMNLMLPLVNMEKVLGGDMSTGLTALKEVLEK